MIRKCRRADLRKLEWNGLFTHHREILERTFAGQRDGTQLMLVADLDGEPIGQAWIDLRRAADREAGLVWAVRIHPRLQSRGLGTRLMRAAQRAIVRCGLHAAEVAVETANDDARRFYERLGYRVIGTLSEHYRYTTPDGVVHEHHLDLLDMRKELAA